MTDEGNDRKPSIITTLVLTGRTSSIHLRMLTLHSEQKSLEGLWKRLGIWHHLFARVCI